MAVQEIKSGRDDSGVQQDLSRFALKRRHIRQQSREADEATFHYNTFMCQNQRGDN